MLFLVQLHERKTMSFQATAVNVEDSLDFDEFIQKLALAQKGDSVALNQLFVQFSSLVKIIVGRFAKKGICVYYSYDDLIQEGNIGLFSAIKNCYEVNDIACFVEYASMRIRGEILDALRRNSYFSRHILEGSKEFDKIRRELENKFGRKPKVSEIRAIFPGKFIDNFDLIRSVNEGNFVTSGTLFYPNEEEDVSIFDSLSNGDETVEDLYYRTQSFNLINHLVFRDGPLTQKEKEVLVLYYFRELKLGEIGQDMGLDESRICQIRQAALKKIYARLEKRHPELLNYFSD